MDETNLIVCPQCGFEYHHDKHAFCPNCNSGKDKKNFLIPLSEKALHLPIGVKIAVLLTSTYALYYVADLLVHQLVISLVATALYLGFIYFWFNRIDNVERPVWFLSMIMTMYLPVLTLISLIIFR